MLLLKKLSSGQKLPEGINREALRDIPAHGHLATAAEAPLAPEPEAVPEPVAAPKADPAMDALFAELDFPDATSSSSDGWDDDFFDD